MPAIEDVLVIGAGSGNDVAAALLFGARHVDAVESDPVIAGLGKKYHPGNPYTDPPVNLVVDDARAFMHSLVEFWNIPAWQLVTISSL